MSVYSKNQAGYLTDRPVRWALALESYINKEPETHCRWQYKINKKTGKYSECYLIF